MKNLLSGKWPTDRLSIVLAVLVVGWGTACCAQAQDDKIPPPDLAIVEVVPPATMSEKIDSVFAEIVAVIEKVMFHRFGTEERLYVEFKPEAIYYRAAGSNGTFKKLNPTNSYAPAELSPDEVLMLAARDELLPGHVVNHVRQNFRRGSLNKAPVEYVIIKRDDVGDDVAAYGDQFMRLPDGRYGKLSKGRKIPLEGQVFEAQSIAQWGDAGFLVMNPNPLLDEPTYLQKTDVGGVPFVVAWLAAGAVFFTLYMRFFNFWGVRHAIQIVRGVYDNPAETGEVTHFQALSSALSATVGLGNIAGVTIAMTLGGPGAFFWMLVCGVLGMSTKFAECTLGVKYREILPDGTVLGGPMRYLRVGLGELGLAPLGVLLSVLFTFMCIFASFGGGNMIQANQSGSAVLEMFQQGNKEKLLELKTQMDDAAEAGDTEQLRDLRDQRRELSASIRKFEGWFKPIYGLILAAMVAVVIIGGIKRIGAAAEKIVPTMCVTYMLACLYIIVVHIDRIPAMVQLIFESAFSGQAVAGGILGTVVVGVQRAAFSNEAGAGSAAIAHSAARTNEPIREGCVALLEPFIDTVLVCSMTALVILITGAWNHEEWISGQGLEGAALTSRAFSQEISWFPIVLSIAVMLFAYSTIISWSYYGERSWAYFFGTRSIFLYRILAVIFVFIGSVVNLGSVLVFSDMMILGMAFPNILGVILLSPKVRRDLKRYWRWYKSGEMPKYK